EDKKEGDDPLAALLGDKANPKSEQTMVIEARKEPETVPNVKPGIGHNGGPAIEVPKKVSAPREIKKPHKVEGWYKQHAGWVPPNYMSYPEVDVRPKVPVASKDDLKKLGEAFKTSTKILPDIGSSPADIAKRTPPKIASVPKVVAPVEPIKQPEKVAEPPKVEHKKDAIPSMSTESQKGLIDKWLKDTETLVHTTDRSGNAIVDPKDAPALEEKYTPFAERLGIKFEDIFRWKVERLEKLLYDYPDAALHLMCDLRLNCAKMMKTASVVQEPSK